MVIVAGHITVEPQQRESYLAGCVSVVERARGAAGCLDFAITADPIDPVAISPVPTGLPPRSTYQTTPLRRDGWYDS